MRAAWKNRLFQHNQSATSYRRNEQAIDDFAARLIIEL